MLNKYLNTIVRSNIYLLSLLYILSLTIKLHYQSNSLKVNKLSISENIVSISSEVESTFLTTDNL